MPTTQTVAAPSFTELLSRATTDPGVLSAAYTAFHNYSLGNILLAAWQCAERGLAFGPIASFNRWKELGRHVVKGSKAIELCMPVTCKRAVANEAGDEETATFTRFVFRRNWFVLAQTDGAAYEAHAVPGWDKTRALEALDVTEVPFSYPDGNCQGYAMARTVAVSPVAANGAKTLFHEIAHVIIGHTSEGQMVDGERTARDIRELEAEGTAMLVCAALGLPGLEDSRGYIQHWVGAGFEIPEASARKIFKAADAILKAGRVEAADDSTEVAA